MPIDLSCKPGFKSTLNPGLIIYLTVGDPNLAATREIALAAIDAGADVLELGVPFSDPVADGPVIQRASERALAQGTRLEDVLALAGELRRLRPSVGTCHLLLLQSYSAHGPGAVLLAGGAVRRGWRLDYRFDR